MSEESLNCWIRRLNEGDGEAVRRVFLAYEPYLRFVVRRRMSRQLRVKVDSGDIVQSVFADLLSGLRGGGRRFADSSQLRAFLRCVASRRLADCYRKHGPSLERERSLCETPPGDHPHSALPRPSEVAQGREFLERILGSCPPLHQEIVRLRMSGMRLFEIAARTGLHEGSVRRILYDMARRLSITRRSALGPPNDVT